MSLPFGMEGTYASGSTLSPLQGRWRARRRVVDLLARRTYAFEGTATITADEFIEQGEVVAGDRSFAATRRYGLRERSSGSDVLFPNGRLFVRLELRPDQRLEHLCGEDVYRGRLFFLSTVLWVELWRVRGRSKNYKSLTRFERTTD